MLFGETRYVYSKGFQRRNFLYGSRQFKADNDKVFLVEGSLDCIRMHQLGFTNTVASMGTKVSPTQRSLLKRLGSEVILAFDNDPAGVVASKEQSQLLLREGYRVGHLRYPQGDPGDIESPTDVEEISCVEYALTY
jgi:DNA primase